MKNDLTGQRFGRLLVIRPSKTRIDGGVAWHCRCDCGREKIVRAKTMLRPQKPTRSCGCLIGESITKMNQTHGLFGTPIYRVWSGIVTRCYNKKDKNFLRYGAKGILACAGIRESVIAIIDSIGDRPSSDMSIDRIDNGLGYFCGKCQECVGVGRPINIRWATNTEQQCNKSNNVLIAIGGKSKTMSQWARIAGISIPAMWGRVHRGWSGERLLTPIAQ